MFHHKYAFISSMYSEKFVPLCTRSVCRCTFGSLSDGYLLCVHRNANVVLTLNLCSNEQKTKKGFHIVENED